jgi:cell division GTPase FtsZ
MQNKMHYPEKKETLEGGLFGSSEAQQLFDQAREAKAVIKVLGVGGAGGNAVNRMIASGMTGVEFWVLNTDAQVLEMAHTQNRLKLGNKITRGLGAGGNPSIAVKIFQTPLKVLIWYLLPVVWVVVQVRVQPQ